MKWLRLLAAAAVLVAEVPTVAGQETIPFNWFIPAGDSLPPITVNVGDTIVFNWSGFHNVFIHPTGDCTEDGAIEVGGSSGASYTFTEDDVGDMEFVCDVGAHCEVGMRVTITVAAASTSAPVTPAPVTPAPVISSTPETIEMNWFIPAGDSLPPLTVNVGDTLVFNWGGFHNVFIHPTGDCTEDGAIEVGGVSGASYTFTEADVGDVEFVCDVGAHCEVGMRVTVTVQSVTSAPVTIAPVTAAPVTAAPVTEAPVTAAPVTEAPVTAAPVTAAPVTAAPVTAAPITAAPITAAPVTAAPVTAAPITAAPVTEAPATAAPVTFILPGFPVSIDMDWFIPDGDSFPPMTVSVGDTIVFNWSGFHNVYIHPTGDCTETGAILVGTETGASYTFTDADVGDLEFVCDVGSHCERGMRVTITVIAGGATTAPVTASPVTTAPNVPTFILPGFPVSIDMDWFIPDGDSFPPMTVSVGDTIVFNWIGFHNVYIHPTGDCTETGAILVGTETGASYTFTDADVGDLEFVCDVGSHCELGMRVTITVIAGGTTAAPVSAAPVTAAPVSASPVTAAPVSAAPVTAAPVSASPVTTAPNVPTFITPGFPDSIQMDWFIPAEDSFPPMTVSVGDTIVFNWIGFHNVYIHPTGDCTETGAILVGTETGASYTFTDADVGDLEFVCDVGSHCELGMRVTITVIAGGTTAAPVSAAPVTAAPATPAPVVAEATPAPSSSPSVSDAPSISPAPTPRRSFPNFCFSGNGIIETQANGAVAMGDLKLGDKVLVSGNKYEEIYSFGHRHEDSIGRYLQIHSRDAKTPLEMSPDHMVQLEGGSFVPASHLEVGSKLVQHDGSSTVVENIREVESRGVYAPFTESGTIVVNGIVASTFVAFQNSSHIKLGESMELPISFQWMAHAFESFHRLVWRVVGGSGYWSLETYTNDGVSRWVDLPHRFAEWLWVQHPFVIVSIVTPVCALLGTVYALERCAFASFALALIVMISHGLTKTCKKQKIA